jgi:hypothetical protein
MELSIQQFFRYSRIIHSVCMTGPLLSL